MEKLEFVGADTAHISQVFNLIQYSCLSDYFNPVYRKPSYQAGLAVKLFGVRFLSAAAGRKLVSGTIEGRACQVGVNYKTSKYFRWRMAAVSLS